MNKPWFQFIIYAASFAMVALLASCAKEPVLDEDIIATWGDTAMTVAQFKAKMYVRYQNEARAKARPYGDRLKIIEEYLVRDLKLLEGQRLGFAERKDIRKSYDDAVEREASERIYDAKVRNRLISKEILQNFWERSKVDLRVRHLLIEIPDTIAVKDTIQYWNRINEIWEKAKTGKNFKRLVDKYSDDSSIDRELHGDLGYFYWGKMVDEFEQAAWDLAEPGDISPPVRTRYGYHLIQLIDRRSAGLEVHTSHILVKVSSRSTPAETTLAWEHAIEILNEATKKGANFTQLARRYSEDRKTWNSGEIGWIKRGIMPTEYWDKAFSMDVGSVDGPVRSNKGYHIIKVNDRRDLPKSIDDKDFRRRMYSRLSRIYSDTLEIIAKNFTDSIKIAFEMKYDRKVVKNLLKKLNDTSVPANINRFSAFTAEEREDLVVTDKLGGFKVQILVDQYGDHRFPPQYREGFDFIEELVEPILLPKYLAEVARQEGYFDDPEIIAVGVKALNNAMLPEVEREIINNRATPNEEEIQAFYKENIEKYTEKAKATVYEIQVEDKKLAGELFQKVKGGEDISKLARRHSVRRKTRNRGGRLGPFAEDKYGAMSRKAITLEPDEIAGPIEHKGKYSIIKLISKRDAKVKTLDEVRKQLESDVRFKKQKELKVAWEAELRKAYNLTIDMKALKNVWPIVEQLPKTVEDERKNWDNERKDQAKKINAENQIKLKLRPGTTQEFTTKDGRQVKVNIGQPVYKDKDGNVIDPGDSQIKLSSKKDPEKRSGDKESPRIRIGTSKETAKPVIKLKPKPKGK